MKANKFAISVIFVTLILYWWTLGRLSNMKIVCCSCL